MFVAAPFACDRIACTSRSVANDWQSSLPILARDAATKILAHASQLLF